MSNDSIEQILNDCTMSPKAYCLKHDCGQGIYDELADYVPDMCIHLVGRTEAVMRHSASGPAIDGTTFRIGDHVMRRNGRGGRVIGYAMGEDGRRCLVLSIEGIKWKTYLCPVSEAVPMRLLNRGDVLAEVLKAMERAANGYDYTPESAMGMAKAIVDMAYACFTKSYYPMGDSK